MATRPDPALLEASTTVPDRGPFAVCELERNPALLFRRALLLEASHQPAVSGVPNTKFAELILVIQTRFPVKPRFAPIHPASHWPPPLALITPSRARRSTVMSAVCGSYFSV